MAEWTLAYIRKRGNSWRVEVARKGFPEQSKTFKTKASAAAWARKIEYEMDSGTWIDNNETRSNNIDYMIDSLIYSYDRFGEEIAKPKLSQLNMLKEYFKIAG